MTRPGRALGVLALGGMAAAAASLVVVGSAHAGDGNESQALEQIQALLPEDPDALTDDAAGRLIDEMSTIAGGVVTGPTEESSELTGPCGGFAFSYDGDGALIDAAFDLGDDRPPQDLVDGGQAFTSGNPFQVDADGRVTYFGFADPAPQDHEWALSVGGVGVASGDDPNTGAKNRNAGVIELDDELPFPLTAKFPASGKMTSSIGVCEGSGHVEVSGNGLLDPAGLAGMGLALIGLLGLLFSAPPARTWKAG